jgi:hypothetical protein
MDQKLEIRKHDCNLVKNPSIFIMDSNRQTVNDLIHTIIENNDMKSQRIYNIDFNDPDIEDVIIDYTNEIDRILDIQKTKIDQQLPDPDIVVVIYLNIAIYNAIRINEHFRELMMNGRHYRITYFVVGTEYLNMVTETRFNLDYIFTHKLFTDSAIIHEKLWLNYYTICPNLQVFNNIFRAVNNDMYFMQHNRTVSTELTDKLFWVKPKNYRSIEPTNVDNSNSLRNQIEELLQEVTEEIPQLTITI